MIDKASIASKIAGSKEAKDYTYAILFLLISSFFAIAVIKPVLSIAISLDKEAKELKKINTVFEKNITNVVTLQGQMQEVRSQAYLINSALPQDPSIQDLITDIRNGALTLGINVKTIDVTEPDAQTIVDPMVKIKARPITMKLAIESDFDQAILLTKSILNQRRLKTINSISLDKSSDESGAGYLTINLELDGYYYNK